ncbi:unnamed protein product [Polarella glacialis]|uniref:Apple domain-containing protein n=1 Tax=Polarella glacialis TaxID=89957 RepID=A0A813L517_POLGL|nr:unnamed protein product [Polarella glacialis]
MSPGLLRAEIGDVADEAPSLKSSKSWRYGLLEGATASDDGFVEESQGRCSRRRIQVGLLAAAVLACAVCSLRPIFAKRSLEFQAEKTAGEKTPKSAIAQYFSNEDLLRQRESSAQKRLQAVYDAQREKAKEHDESWSRQRYDAQEDARQELEDQQEMAALEQQAQQQKQQQSPWAASDSGHRSSQRYAHAQQQVQPQPHYFPQQLQPQPRLRPPQEPRPFQSQHHFKYQEHFQPQQPHLAQQSRYPQPLVTRPLPATQQPLFSETPAHLVPQGEIPGPTAGQIAHQQKVALLGGVKRGFQPLGSVAYPAFGGQPVKRETEAEKRAKAKAKVAHKLFTAEYKEVMQMLKWQAVRSCSAQLVNVEVHNGQPIASIEGVNSAAKCQMACTESLQCDAFSFRSRTGDDGPKNVCFMKKLEANAEPHMVIKDGLISGYPCCRPTSSPTEYIQSECPGHFADTDLSTKSGLPSKYGITSADWCQRVCTEDADCGAWTWGEARNVPGLSDVCYMKKLAGDEAPGMHMKQGVVSGLPCGCRSTAMNAIWPDTDVQRFDMPAPRALQKPEPASMLCVALMLPYSYEQDMLVMQFQEKANIFGCDHWAVYSNQEMKLAPGLVTRRVQTTQRCEIGGEFGTALNLGVFTALWRQVLLDDEYVKVNWIIKADPDTVFFPERLRPILKAMEKKEGNGRDGKGVYLNNCKYGLHGPIEVFSTRAISTLANDFETCFAYFRKLCSGDCLWGEDMWVDQCLQRVANVTRIDEFKLLSESHCDPEPGWNSCYDHSKVAFHPFKDISGYKTCLQSAREVDKRYYR